MFFLNCLIKVEDVIKPTATICKKKEKFMTNIDEEIKPCMDCLAPNDVSAIFCEVCGSSFGTPSMIYPQRVIQANGVFRRKFPFTKILQRKPRFIVLFTCWLLTPPMCLILAQLAISEILDRENHYGNWFMSFFFFWCEIGLLYTCLRILYFVTKHYLKMRKLQQSKNN